VTTPDFATWQAICETKARYCRCLDTKDWAGYGDVFTEDAVLDATPSGGQKIAGRAAMVAFVRGSVESAATVHQVHSPEIRLTGTDSSGAQSAEVVWAMQDRVMFGEERAQATGLISLTGFGHYHEHYRCCADGLWRITRSTLTRLHVDYIRA